MKKTADTEVLTDEEMDALLDEASVEADAETMVSEPEEEEKPLGEEEAIRAVESETDGDKRYLCEFSKEYTFDGKKIKELDLSGLLDLTTKDLEFVDFVFAKMGYAPQNKYDDILWRKHIAMRATGMPVEFFNMLSARDMMYVGAKVWNYFLYE